MGIYSNGNGLPTALKALRVGLAGFQGYTQQKALNDLLEQQRQAKEAAAEQAIEDAKFKREKELLNMANTSSEIGTREDKAFMDQRDAVLKKMTEGEGITPDEVGPFFKDVVLPFNQMYGDKYGDKIPADITPEGFLKFFGVGAPDEQTASQLEDNNASLRQDLATPEEAQSLAAATPLPGLQDNQVTAASPLFALLSGRRNLDDIKREALKSQEAMVRLAETPDYRKLGYSREATFKKKVEIPEVAKGVFTQDRLEQFGHSFKDLVNNPVLGAQYLDFNRNLLLDKGATAEEADKILQGPKSVLTAAAGAQKQFLNDETKRAEYVDGLKKDFIREYSPLYLSQTLGKTGPLAINMDMFASPTAQAEYNEFLQAADRAATWVRLNIDNPSSMDISVRTAKLLSPDNRFFKTYVEPSETDDGYQGTKFNMTDAQNEYVKEYGIPPAGKAKPGQPAYTYDPLENKMYVSDGKQVNVITDDDAKYLTGLMKQFQEDVRTGRDQRNAAEYQASLEAAAKAPDATQYKQVLDQTPPPPDRITAEALKSQVANTVSKNVITSLFGNNRQPTPETAPLSPRNVANKFMGTGIGALTRGIPSPVPGADYANFLLGGRSNSKPLIDQDVDGPPLTAEENKQRHLRDYTNPDSLSSSFAGAIFDGVVASKGRSPQ